jgi:hypothetical protein|tara:strand:- start:31 stop:258 length:228 start_codon:yes stop_codon:yes gene_type:complete
MKRDSYQIGDLLIKLSNQQPHVITAIRETGQREYGAVGSIRQEYQLYGRFWRTSKRNREHRWVSDVSLRAEFQRP